MLPTGDDKDDSVNTSDPRLVATLRLVILLNLAAFSVEFSIAVIIDSVALFADSVDFLEDMAMSGLVLAAQRFSARARARLGMGLAGLLLLPAGAMLIALVQKLMTAAPIVPAPAALSLTGLAAFIVNIVCALLLARVKNHAGSLTRAAFLSARNDVIGNVAIIAAGGITALWPSIWPDIVVGLGIAALNADSAFDVLSAARREHGAAGSGRS
jgi:Co/Zn/Cd efflux system component